MFPGNLISIIVTHKLGMVLTYKVAEHRSATSPKRTQLECMLNFEISNVGFFEPVKGKNKVFRKFKMFWIYLN